MTTIPDHLSAFIRFIQLKFLRKRTEEEYVRWVTRLARQGGVACRSLLGQEEVLAFLHDLQQNHDHEGSTLNQAVCALMYRTINDLSLYPICPFICIFDHTGWRASGWRGLPGSVSPATTEAAGGWRLGWRTINDLADDK